jgi:diguanylate cyclase (GGDEF)-like protein/PAS domain S-box-containing protein
LAVVVIAIIWGGIYLLAGEERERAYQDAVRQGSNLTRVLEEYINRVVQQTDSALRALRRVYQRDPQNFDIASWATRTQVQKNFTLIFGIVGADGFVKQSSSGALLSPVYVGDRAHFKFQTGNTDDQLYISAPIMGQISGKLAIQFTRRLSKLDGSFDGIVASSLDVQRLESFFSSLEIGHGGVVSLVGFDGIVRARGGPDPRTQSGAGVSVINSPLFESLSQSTNGNYWNTTTSSTKFDGIRRLISYRVVPGLPLVAVVGLSEDSIFQQPNATLAKYLLAGAILTAIVLVVMVFGAVQQARILSTTGQLRSSKQSLEQINRLLQAALQNMAHGLCMFDHDQRLVISNERYAEMYRLGPEQTKPGATLRSILEARVAAGASPEDTERYVETRLSEVMEGNAYYTENELSDGRVYAVSHQPMLGGGWVAVHQDVTKQRQAEQELDKTKQFLDCIIANIPIAVVVKDAKTRRFLLVNQAFEAMLDLSRNDLLGKTVFDIYQNKAAEFIDSGDSETLGSPHGVNYSEYEVESPNHGTRVHATNRIVIRDPQGNAKYLIAVIEDVTERKKSEQRIAFMAHHDALTGLANRVAVAEKIEEAGARQRRFGEPFSVLLLDLDRFKHVNDTLGHAAGDALLREVAARLKGFLRETDVLARLGGDEFAIIQAAESNQRQAASKLADRITRIIAKPFNIDGTEFHIAASIGIALAPEHATDTDSLLKMADMALYSAKSAGRNGYRFFGPEMSAAASERQDLETDLRRAIAQEEFELHYQPIIDTQSGKVSGAEALIRWRHATKGMIPPDQFIPLAEDTGLIAQIGEWVLHTACLEAATWPEGVKVAVNLSAVQFRKSDLPDVVMYALAKAGLPPERLELEITETALIESAAECLPALRQFKNLGITVALDDFGTGYSSLSQLTLFPFNKIKIDKSFTQNLTKRTECAAIISGTLALAQSLNIETTAEGVETVQQYQLLRLAGVTSLQGYLFQRPCPANEIDFNGIYTAPEREDAA